MKSALRILAALLILALLPLAALADSPVILFTPQYGVTTGTMGQYARITQRDAYLYTGPGTEYISLCSFQWNNQQMRCICLAKDSLSKPWVLVDFSLAGDAWRGYIPLASFDASTQRHLSASLPWESSYDALTPMMIAQIYHDVDALCGPGEKYFAIVPLDRSTTEGTLIMQEQNWVLMELEVQWGKQAPKKKKKHLTQLII